MLNAEKYRSQISDIIEGGHPFAVGKDKQNIVRSCAGISCETCIFNEEEKFFKDDNNIEELTEKFFEVKKNVKNLIKNMN